MILSRATTQKVAAKDYTEPHLNAPSQVTTNRRLGVPP